MAALHVYVLALPVIVFGIGLGVYYLTGRTDWLKANIEVPSHMGMPEGFCRCAALRKLMELLGTELRLLGG